ncbi:hypothetical protein [Candidatus Poriferisodalis sp.]|uniref:hypothetical protein n=1 Tax=Candidatus Poriferisodalis sp. TaxID=3101277 RepID=UPI003B0249D0
MASPDSPPVDPSDTEGEGLLETIGAQLATLAAQVSEIDQRMSSVESGTPSQPVEVRLSPETVAQIADALAALQAAGSQALDEAFKTASDDLNEALSGLVRSEISRTLTDAGYTVEVTEVAEPGTGDAPFEDDIGSDATAESDTEALPEREPIAASVRSAPDAAAMPSIVAPLAAAERADAAYESIRSGSESNTGVDDADDVDGDVIDTDRAPLRLDELDDPFLDALIRKEPLSA